MAARSEQDGGDLTVARHALISAAAGYAGMLAVMIAVHLAVSRRDWVRRQAARARRVFRPLPSAADLAVLEEMRVHLDQLTHADLTEEPT